ncbi:hypothetical protein TWF281_008866 [Arthrobotrys megalospora]
MTVSTLTLRLLRRSASSRLISPSSRRTFTSLLRPSYLPPTTTSYRPTPQPTYTSLLPQTISPSSNIPTSTLPGIQQTRGHRRKTYNPSHIVRKRRFGFLARLRSKTGKNILKRRKAKGRKMLTH